MPFEFAPEDDRAMLKVIGVGGAGGNAVNRMIESGVSGVEFITADTDTQRLSLANSPQKIPLGSKRPSPIRFAFWPLMTKTIQQSFALYTGLPE